MITLSTETEKIIFAKLTTLEGELSALRQGFVVVNRKYSEVLTSLKKLSELSVEATQRASAAACRAESAARKAADTAKIAASQSILQAAEDAAAHAAAESAEATRRATEAAAEAVRLSTAAASYVKKAKQSS